MILTAQAVSLIYQFWIHTEFIGRLGPLEWVLNTPSHHRVHHGSNVEYLDRNYGGILIVWDRLFGSFEPERGGRSTTDSRRTSGPSVRSGSRSTSGRRCSATSGRRARGATGPVYLLRPPGWSPDGSTLTARQMQRQRA